MSTKNLGTFVFAFMATSWSMQLAADGLPTIGNGEEVISEVAGALENGHGDEVGEGARQVRALALTGLRRCPQAPGTTVETTTETTEFNRSPIDGGEARPDRVQFFFDLQYIAVGNNGEQSFQSSGVPRINSRDVIGTYAMSNGMTRDQVLALSDSELRQILVDGSSLTGPAREDAANSALLITRLSQTSSSDEMYAMLNQRMSGASFGQKVNFLANFLDYLSDNYDFDAINGGATQGNDVSDADMMRAINESIRTGQAVPAGVCRHMHQLAVRYARAMGINEAFGVGFRTPGGGHRTMVLTHPDDPTKVVQLNYGQVSENNGVAGPEALSQNHSLPDAGIRFRIYNGNDEPAIILPSEQGAILNYVTGGEDSDLSPNYRSNAQIQQFGVATPYGTVRFFHATTPMGNQSSVTGGSYNVRVNYNDVFYGEYGIAGFHSERPTEAGDVTMSGAYARTTQGFNWRFYQSEDVNVAAFGELHLRGAVYCAKVGDGDCETNGDYNVDAQYGINADYVTGPISHRTSLLFQTQLDQAHATNGDMPGLMTPTIRLTHDMDFQIAPDIYGNVGGGVTMYNLGTGTYYTYNGHAGVDVASTGTSFAFETTGRITNDTPFWLPDAERQGTLSVRQDLFGDRLYMGVDGRQSFDVLQNNYVGLSLGGRF